MNGLIEQYSQIPHSKSFSGHETFALRHSWLKKAVDKLPQDPKLFAKPEAIELLGVGKNMVRAIRHWALACRLIEEMNGAKYGAKVTELGTNLLSNDGWDPYMEDDGTLWLLHWNLCSRGAYTPPTWYYAFSMHRQRHFTRQQLQDAISVYIDTLGWKVSPNILMRDIECLCHTYCHRTSKSDDVLECPLSELGLIDVVTMKNEEPALILRHGPKPTLPDAIFTYALLDFWDTCFSDRYLLDFGLVDHNDGSPGLVFQLNPDSLANILDKVADLTGGSVRFDDTLQTRQLNRKTDISLGELKSQVLKEYYCGSI